MWCSRSKIGAAASLLVLGAALTAWTWGTWPDAIVDYGRELYAAWRVSEGDALYRDLFWLNGPLSVHLNALLFQVFGVGLWTLVAANLVLIAGVTWMLVCLIARRGGPFAGWLAGATYLALFAFHQYVGYANYNFVTPYSHELTHGFALSLAALLLLDSATRNGQARYAVSSGICFGLVLLTKAEVALAVSAGLTPLLLTLLGRRRLLLGFAAGSLLPLLVAWLLLASSLGAGPGLRATFGAFTHALDPRLRALPFYRSGAGLDAPGPNLLRALENAGWIVAALAPLALAARALPARLAAHPLTLLVGGGVVGWLSQRALGAEGVWMLAVTGLPVLVLAILAWDLLAERRAARIALDLFALVLLAKIVLFSRVVHYGFVLALPAFLLVVETCAGRIPSALAARGRSGWPARAGLIGALGAMVLVYSGQASARYHWKDGTLGRGSDAFAVAGRGKYAARMLELIAEHAQPGDKLLVVPEGVMLNYLARIETPLSVVNLMPPELLLAGEETLLAQLQADPPRLLVVTEKDTSEYGPRYFGQDYATRIGRWLGEHYVDVELVGEPPLMGRNFGIALLVRR